MEDWGAVRDRLEVDAEEMVKEFRSAGSKRQGADIRTALGEIRRLKRLKRKDHGQCWEEFEAAEAAHKEAAAQWQDESRLRREAEANVALLDQAATDYRKARDVAETKLEEKGRAFSETLLMQGAEITDLKAKLAQAKADRDEAVAEAVSIGRESKRLEAEVARLREAAMLRQNCSDARLLVHGG